MEKIKVPRRNQFSLFTRAEIAIYDAIQKVEDMPADEKLTNAILHLQSALKHVSDYVDDQLK